LIYGTALSRPSEFDFTELILMTHDPARSAPAVALRLRQLPGKLRLAAPTVPGFTYALEFSDTLEFETFASTGQPVGSDVAVASPGSTDTDNTGFRVGPERLLRLQRLAFLISMEIQLAFDIATRFLAVS
jgi:hypothetical protein